MEKRINQAMLACREFEIQYSGIATGFIIQSQLILLFRCISNCSDGFQGYRMRLVLTCILLERALLRRFRAQTASNRSIFFE